MNSQLSAAAQKLLAYLIQTDGAWKANCMDAIFNKPSYLTNNEAAQTAYWQWEANAYGYNVERPVCGKSVEFVSKHNYSWATSEAYQELRAAGLAGEKNNGYNEYWLFPITAACVKYKKSL